MGAIRGTATSISRRLSGEYAVSMGNVEIEQVLVLRADEPEIQRAVKLDGDAPASKAFGRLRKRRDKY